VTGSPGDGRGKAAAPVRGRHEAGPAGTAGPAPCRDSSLRGEDSDDVQATEE